MSKKIFFVFIFFIVSFVFWGDTQLIALAQTNEYVPLEPIPGIPTNAPDFPSLLRAGYQFLVGMSAALAVLLITFSGIQYMLTDVAGNKEASKERIKNSLIGLIFLLAIYLILATINPKLLEFNLTLRGISGTNVQNAISTEKQNLQTAGVVGQSIGQALSNNSAAVGVASNVQTPTGSVPYIIQSNNPNSSTKEAYDRQTSMNAFRAGCVQKGSNYVVQPIIGVSGLSTNQIAYACIAK